MTTRLVLVGVLLLVALGGWALLARETATNSTSAPAVAAPPVAESSASRTPRERANAEAEAAAPDGDSAKTVRLTIHVLADDTGAPIANAEMRYESGETDGSNRTDESGVARVTFDRERGASLHAAAPGFLRRDWNHEDGTESEITVRLSTAAALRGVVVDAKTGAPLSGAHLVAEQGGEQTAGFGVPATPYADVVTGPDGTFLLDHIPPSGPTSVAVTAPGHVRDSLEWNSEKPRRIEFRMEPAGSVRGVVRDGDGKPVEGLRVTASSSDAPSEHATSGPGGAYEIEGLALGHEYDIVALEQWYDPLRASAATERVRLTADALSATRDLVMLRPARLTVHLRDPDGGAVADAAVKVEMADLVRRFKMDAAGDGSAVIERPGRCRLAVVSPRFVPYEREFNIAAGAADVFEVVLPRGREIRGVVVDDDGATIAGASICARRDEMPASSRWSNWETAREATSSDDGTFVLSGCEYVPYVVLATAADHHSVQIEGVAAPRTDLRMVLPKRPVGTVALKLAEKGVTLGLWFAGTDDAESTREAVLTDDDDPAHEFQVRPGTYDLAFTAVGFAGTTRRVVVKAGETLDLGEIALDRGIALAGRVVDAEGRAVPDATVKAVVVDDYVRFDADRDPSPVAWSDASGAFRLAHVAAGESTLRVVAEGFVAADVKCDVRADAAPFIVTLVRDAEAAPEKK